MQCPNMLLFSRKTISKESMVIIESKSNWVQNTNYDNFSFKVNGTTGEGILSLTVDERMELAEAWIKEKDKVPTQIMQVGGCAFRDAQKLVRFYERFTRSNPHPCHQFPISKFKFFLFCSRLLMLRRLVILRLEYFQICLLFHKMWINWSTGLRELLQRLQVLPVFTTIFHRKLKLNVSFSCIMLLRLWSFENQGSKK